MVLPTLMGCSNPLNHSSLFLFQATQRPATRRNKLMESQWMLTCQKRELALESLLEFCREPGKADFTRFCSSLFSIFRSDDGAVRELRLRHQMHIPFRK